MATPDFICANWSPDHADCKTIGKYSCKNCLLVLYCGQDCQKAHWSSHKPLCRAPMGKTSWQPRWVLEHREPAFVGDDRPPVVQFGGQKYLWGNVPALDILQLGSNEGEEYEKELKLLFAASGDLRNAVKTIAQLPRSYSQPLEVTLNDRDLDIVARNAIMLLIALVVDNMDEAVDCIIHTWYSTLLRASDLDILQQRVRPLIEAVCEEIRDKPPSSLVAKCWTFGSRSLRLALKKSSWNRLLSFAEVPEGLTMDRARLIRAAVIFANSRKDYRDRHMVLQSPFRRLAKYRFRKDGLLLPFGSPRDDFLKPNPTFFQTSDNWPMPDSADPLEGWSLKEVEDRWSGPAAADIYGKLFYHLRATLRAFITRMSALPRISFQLFQMDASELSRHLESGTFARIEVSNISDMGYLGIHQVVACMIPLLQKPLDNPYATLITLFMNAVPENTTRQDQMADLDPNGPALTRLLKYLPMTRRPTGQLDAEMTKFMVGRDIVATYCDRVFYRFMKDFEFDTLAGLTGAVLKDPHTVVEKWPFRLKLRPGQPGAQEEFDRLLGVGGVTGRERYVEWKRTDADAEVDGSGVDDNLVVRTARRFAKSLAIGGGPM